MYPTLRQIKITHRESIPSVSSTLTIGGRKRPPVQGSSVTGLRAEFVKVYPPGEWESEERRVLWVSQGLVNARRNYASENYALQQRRVQRVIAILAPLPKQKMTSSTADFNRATPRFLACFREVKRSLVWILEFIRYPRARDNGVTLGMGKLLPRVLGFRLDAWKLVFVPNDVEYSFESWATKGLFVLESIRRLYTLPLIIARTNLDNGIIYNRFANKSDLKPIWKLRILISIYKNTLILSLN